jgi:hypothetical protein
VPPFFHFGKTSILWKKIQRWGGKKVVVTLNCMTSIKDTRPGESSFSSFFLTSSPNWQQSKAWNQE